MSKDLKHTHLVSFSGPEWNEPIATFSKRKDAEKYAAYLDKHGKEDWRKEMSKYTVTKVPHNSASAGAKSPDAGC